MSPLHCPIVAVRVYEHLRPNLNYSVTAAAVAGYTCVLLIGAIARSSYWLRAASYDVAC